MRFQKRVQRSLLVDNQMTSSCRREMTEVSSAALLCWTGVASYTIVRALVRSQGPAYVPERY